MPNIPNPIARLFFALWPDDAMRVALADAVADVVREVSTPRAVPAANYHFTLAFLGAVPRAQLEVLRLVAAQFATDFRHGPITITLDTLEHWRKPQVLVATSSIAPPSAVALAEGLNRALINASFAPDAKPFRPHLTLARKVTAPMRSTPLAPLIWTFTRFALVESRTDPAGSIYTSLDTFEFSANFPA